MRSAQRSPRRAAAGFTLIEIMVALAIGLSVVGALIAAYVASTRSGRHTDALVQITEDATLALAVVRQQVSQAGFGVARPGSGSGIVLPTFPPVRGCEASDFVDLQAAISAPSNCAAAGANPDAPDTLEIAYEASVQPGPSSNGILGGSPALEPLDCLGNGFPKTHDATAGDYWLQDSKFYVASGSLMCHGPGNAAGAAVVQNVETLQVAYGMAAAPAGASGSGQIVYYDVAPPPGSPLWDNVVAVSVCVQIRSANKVLDSATAPTLGGWVDCRDVARTATDGYMRRSFSTTIVLRNRLS
jgi:type IV pilus assembly protein PilW